jgi:hypothetical protein
MIIQELIAAKVAQMTSNGDTFSFLHSEKDWQNLETDEAVLPSVHLDMPVKVTPSIKMGGAIEERYVCTLIFMYKSNLDNNPDQQYDTLKLAHAAMNQFILLVEDDPDNFDTTKNVFGEALQVVAYPLFDRCVDGIILPFTCVPRNRPNVCIPSYSIPIGDCDPATVENLSGAFSQLIASGDTFTLQSNDYSFANSEGTMIINGSAEAQTDIVGVLPDIDFTDSDGITTQVASGKNIIATPLTCPGTAELNSTGQLGDPYGSFWTLPTGKLNHFNHNWRWCGITGGYTDGVDYFDVNGTVTTRALAFPELLACDLRHVDCDGNFPMYGMGGISVTNYVIYLVANTYNTTYSTASFSNGWRTPSIIELDNAIYFSTNLTYSQKPFEAAQAQWWSSTSRGTDRFLITNTPARTFVPEGGASGMSFPVRTTNILEF